VTVNYYFIFFKSSIPVSKKAQSPIEMCVYSMMFRT